MKADELLRLLRRRAWRLGLDHREIVGKGSHLKVLHGSGRTVVPIHRGDLPLGTFRSILKQLGLTEQSLKD